MADDGNLKSALASTIKWNIVDKVSSQLLYAVTGIVLARMLSQEDFGLTGAIMVFQSFAQLLVDSGFSSALIQRKDPSDTDYSTVFWFNMAMAVALYAILYLCAAPIASLFQGDARLIPLSRVMFVTFIINAALIVQVNRLIKRMTVKLVAVANSAGLFAGAVVGISLALAGYGAWAIVWQAIATGTVKGAVLWWQCGWVPRPVFSLTSLRGFFRVGAGVMGSSFLNTVFQNIYSFIIGNRVGLVALGYFTQADKWSKMGVMSLSQVLTTSFLPVLSRFQDVPDRFALATARMNRLTAYLLCPAMGFLAVMATPVFHALFSTKWDAAIPLFRLLLLRGVFTVLTQVYSHYILALGRSRLLVVTEIVRDGVALAAIAFTLPYIGLSRPGNLTDGLAIFLWGQVIASAATWIATLVVSARLTTRSPWQFVRDLLPYVGLTTPVMLAMGMLATVVSNPWTLLGAQALTGLTLYVGANAALGSAIQREVLSHLRR